MPLYRITGRFNRNRPATTWLRRSCTSRPSVSIFSYNGGASANRRPNRSCNRRRRRHHNIIYGNVANVYDYGHVAEDDDSTDEDEDENDNASGERRRQADERRRTRTRPNDPDPADREVLSVDAVDFQVSENVRKHHTDEYDVTQLSRPRLVVRRGEPFNIKITFNQEYDASKHDLRLVFTIGEQPKPSKGTHVEFVLSDRDVAGEWGAKISKTSGRDLVVSIFTPPDCIVGTWKFKVDVVKTRDNKTAVFRYNHREPIYILFNPWCREDTVFLDNEAERQAYVMEDKGKIYAGNYKRISAKPWVFGQFSGNVLDCCMYILDLSNLNLIVRGNPVPVARKLTAMVNSSDDGGVLTGNWSGDYSGGKSPLSWTGSAPILEEYYEKKFSVAFGQCWVFSGVLTTVLRALGIPARSVTNFASAHDVDSSITIDYHFDEDGNPLEEYDEDSVWNFHVWNEAWMARPDLPHGYGGWQALDSTPQETSDGVFCCGPCPVAAIKGGEVNLPYDGPFIFAEVNADKVYWIVKKDGTNQRAHLQKNGIGKYISTLSLRGEREDVTKHYKHPEDTSEERAAVLRASRVGARSRPNVYDTGPEDVNFELEFDADNTYVGNDFVVTLRFSNSSKESRTVDGVITANTMYYTGVVADLIGKNPFHGVALKPGESKDVSLVLPQDRYNRKLKDCCMIAVSVMARVKETDQVFTKKDDMRLRKPHLTIKGPKEGKVGDELEIDVSFTNPLGMTLTDCVLEVESPGITDMKKYPQGSGDVTPKGTFMTTLRLKPRKQGNKQIIFIFNSKELEDVNGTHDVRIRQ